MTSAPPPPSGFRGRFLLAPDTPPQYARASGPFHLTPAAVAVPADADDVSRLVRWAGETGATLVPRGAGTGMPGHNVGPGVVVDLASGFTDIGAVDPERGTVRVGAGAVAADVARAAAAAGLAFPPLPSSADRCTLGGMLANNAAGARSFRHGAVREWVLEVEVVLAGGDRVTLGPGRPLPAPLSGLLAELRTAHGDAPEGWPAVRKNASGYALDRFLPAGDGAQLLVGSEGTLGIITSALLRLSPAPAARGVALLALPRLDDLPGVAHRAEALGASACEYLGRRILEMARLDGDPELGPLSRAAEALILVEVEGDADRVEEGMDRLRRLATELGTPHVESRDSLASERLWEVRHRASPTIAAAAERGLRSTQFIEDSVVPRDRLPDYVLGLERILEAAATDAVVFGHAGDGNLHVNPLVDLGAADRDRRVRDILEETADLVARLGGTLTGEHGDGRVRAPFLARIWGSRWTAAFLRVKRTLDPDATFNPGVILPLPDQDPLEGLFAGPWEAAPHG